MNNSNRATERNPTPLRARCWGNPCSVAWLLVLGCWGSITELARASDVLPDLHLRLPSWENSVKAIHLGEVARSLLRLDASSAGEDAFWIGPGRARLLWRQKWRWSGSPQERAIGVGLRGGPILSFDVRFAVFALPFSLEMRFCSLRYMYSDLHGGRIITDELADPQHHRQSVEGGMYLNVPLGTFF